MARRTSRLAVQVVDPRYGPAFDAAEREVASVDPGVEADEWAPRVPSGRAGGPIVFVDGAQRVEAWLSVSGPETEIPIPAVAFAVAAGAVLARDGGRAHYGEIEVERGVIAAGDRLLSLPSVGGFTWKPHAGAPREPSALHGRIGQLRQQTEHSLAERVASPDVLVVLDGRLSFVRDARGPVVGAVKSHHVMYLAGEQARCVAQLAVGERTPLFAIGDDRLSWYQRLPVDRPEGWAGVLRGEVSRSLGVETARALADRATFELPRFAGRAHKDPRAPQNLAPIGALEGRLRHVMGDRRLSLRALRRAALEARLDVPGGGAASPAAVHIAADTLAA